MCPSSWALQAFEVVGRDPTSKNRCCGSYNNGSCWKAAVTYRMGVFWEYLICMYTSIEAGFRDVEGFCNILRIKMVTGAASP